MGRGVTSDKVPAVFGPYSTAIVAEPGEMMFISGNAGFDKNQNLVGKGDVKVQTDQALKNIKSILEDNGFSMRDVVRSTVFLSDMSLWPAFNEEYEKHFEKPYPARTCVGCQLNGFDVEIECTAVKRKED